MPDIRKELPLTREEREAQRLASEQFYTIETRIDEQNKLPPELRTTGKLGLFAQAALSGDREMGPAKIRAVGMPRRGEDQFYTTVAGTYRLPDSPIPTIQSEFGDQTYSDMMLFSDYYRGKPTQPDEITYANPTEFMSKAHEAEVRKSVPETKLFHEPTHRAYNMPFMKDFKGYLEQRAFDAGGTGEKRRDFEVIRSNEHYWLNPARRKYLGAMPLLHESEEEVERLAKSDAKTIEDVARVQKLFAEWLTPERQKKYGMKPIIQAVEPKEKSFYEKMLDKMQGVFDG